LIRLVGIDVDGTLVGSTGSAPAGVWRAVARARAAGIRLALCSGRPAFGVTRSYAQQMDADGWHVFQNGASVVRPVTDESCSAPLPPLTASELIRESRRTGRVLELYGDRAYVVESSSEWARQHAELLGVPFVPRPLEWLAPPIVRAQWLLSPEDAARATAPPGTELAVSTAPAMPEVRFVGMTAAGVSKGSAMRRIAAAYHIDLSEVMYVGDSGNDLSALRIVGYPIAMGNADQAVLATAMRTVGHVDEGGLAEALELALASR